MARTQSPETRLAQSALRLLAKKPWREITLLGVAKAAKVPAKELRALAPAKPALVMLILRHIADETTGAYEADASARDRLFDVGMAWFDVLGRHKPAMRSLYKGLRGDLLTLLDSRGAFISTAEWLMALAEADKGPALSLRAAALALVLARAMPVWLDDDKDLAKTMARLDGDLRRGESVLGKL
jgi:hypothetical protein